MSSMRSGAADSATTGRPVISGVLRVADPGASGLPDLSPGEVLVVDVTDLDTETAEAIAAAEVAAVLNLGRLTTGRYANLGPRVLAEAGVAWVDDLGPQAGERLVEGASVRVEGASVHVGSGRAATSGRKLDLSPVAVGADVVLGTRVADRTAVVAASVRREDQRLIWSLEPEPVIVAVGRAADDLHGLGWVPDIAVVDGTDPTGLPSQRVLRLATDVVVVGGGPGVTGDAELDRSVHRVDTGESATAVALRLMERHGASLVVAVGLAGGATRALSTSVLDARSLSGRSATARHLVLVLLACLVALAVGIALGIGPLAGVTGHDDQVRSGRGTSSVGPGDAAALRRSQEDQQRTQTLVGAAAQKIYAGGLTGHGVAVIGLPGASKRQVATLADQVRLAGGVASRTVQLEPTLLRPDNRSQVDTLGSQLAAQLGDPRVDPTASVYARMGQLLAVATTTSARPVSAPADPTATTVRGALQSAGLVAFPSGVQLAPLVLLVLPPGFRSDTEQTDLLGGLVDGLAGTAAAVVIAGDSASGRVGGGLADLRSQTLTGRVSTVDGVDEPSGQVGTVLALEAALGGTLGAYGLSGADGALPAGKP